MQRVRPAAIDIRLSFGRIWSTLTHYWGNGLMTDTAYVVFGANGGIGAAVSRRLAAAGAGLVLAGRSEKSSSSSPAYWTRRPACWMQRRLIRCEPVLRQP